MVLLLCLSSSQRVHYATLLCRFGRVLNQQAQSAPLEGTIPTYLLPTVVPPVCQGSSCCQEDDYASPYEVRAFCIAFAMDAIA